MIKKTEKRLNAQGQAALILILVTAASLIFLAITLNWGRIAQSKVLLSVSADEAATLLASDSASYGEMEKQTYLNDTNQVKASTGIIVAIVMVVVAIIITIVSWGSGAPAGLLLLADVLSTISVVMAIANLVLQVTVVQPGITSMWNKLQQGQPIPQQFYEGGVAAALQGAVTDQVKIADYLDWNANGIYGNNAFGQPNDKVGRFAVFYTDRLRMINEAATPLIPQVVFFSDQLGELMNGETCAQNANDHKAYGIPIVSACSLLNCLTPPIDPLCQMKIPSGFQLSDTCVGSDPTNTANYNPYCDPCCQPFGRPTNCPQAPAICTTTPDDPSCAPPAQCLTNNPYGPLYASIYDPSFQNYGAGVSFLAQFGRDQQMGPFTTTITPQGSAVNGTFFPNGLYPFFWLMNDYSPQVDTIDPTALTSPGQYHWCVSRVTPGYLPPAGYPTLNQLVLPYTCSGPDCCVNYLAGGVAGGFPAPSATIINGKIDKVGDIGSNPAQDPSFGEGGVGAWLPGDNQMCLANWTYNGSSPTGLPDGTCEWTGSAALPPPVVIPNMSPTVDSLDDTMHTLSDFAVFANTLLNKNVGTLSSTFQSWYPQAAQWIAPNSDLCDDGTLCPSGGVCADASTCNYMQYGRLLSIYNPYSATPVDVLNKWSNVITNWLETDYSSDAWCVPPEATLLGSDSTAEDAYITGDNLPLTCFGGVACPASGVCTDGSRCSLWGDLHHVISCLNYNAGQVASQVFANGTYNYTETPLVNKGSVYNYQQCQALMTSCNFPTTCDDGTQCVSGTCQGDGTPCVVASLTGTACDPSLLGRSLAGPNPNNFNGSCDATVAGSYPQWVQNSNILATYEAPKFALRAQFLNDIYIRALNMQNIFQQGDQTLKSFLAPCSGYNCSTGGPAAQLTFAYSQPSAVSTLPNTVIYGWTDSAPAGGSGGCTNISGNRVGCSHIVKVSVYSTGRCGLYCGEVNSVMPWIQTKTSGFLGTSRSYTLTQRDGTVIVRISRWDEDHDAILFPNTHKLWQMLFQNPQGGTTFSGGGFGTSCTLPSGGYVGLVSNTNNGLAFAGVSAQDQDSLSNAFMLNGSIDPNVGEEASCIAMVNNLLTNAPESHACAQFVASINAAGPSCPGVPCTGPQNDYSLKFINC